MSTAKTIACPACGSVSDWGESNCGRCRAPLTEAKLKQINDDIRGITERFEEANAPAFKSFNGCGTTLLDYRERDGGDWEATRWVIVFGLPVVPLSTYVVRPTRQEAGYGRLTSHLKILSRRPLSPARILRVYALVFAGLFPVIFGSLNSTAVNRTLGGPLAALAMLACVAWAAYVIFWKIKNDGRAYKKAKAAS